MKLDLSEDIYILFLIATINFILSPIIISLTQVSAGIVILINYSILIILGSLLVDEKIPKLLSWLFGISSLIAIWCEYYFPTIFNTQIRLLCSLVFFSLLTFLLMRNVLTAKKISLKIIIGALAGYVLIGILGGILFEFLELQHTGTLDIKNYNNTYTFYYFSFISLSTIGYGDITPVTPPAQALAILMSIVGQFYMVIGVGLFIGKFTSQTNIS